MRSLCVVVPKREGESTRKKLSDMGKLRSDLKIASQDFLLFIPVTDTEGLNMVMGVRDFEEVEQMPTYKVIANIPDELKHLLPSSFDIVGDICVVKLVGELLPHKDEIGKALLEANKSIGVVAQDKGVRGEFRTREVSIIAGEQRTTTIHKEFSLRYEMDIAKMYFSPRLATERKRISELIDDDEIIIDMFAGVGPFSIMIAKSSLPKAVYAIDLNPEAVKYIHKNIQLNKVQNIQVMEGDAKQVVANLPKADRIIMNLPHSSLEYLEPALNVLRPYGTIHLYALSSNPKETMDLIISKTKMSVVIREVHTYSPTQSLFVFDITAD